MFDVLTHKLRITINMFFNVILLK